MSLNNHYEYNGDNDNGSSEITSSPDNLKASVIKNFNELPIEVRKMMCICFECNILSDKWNYVILERKGVPRTLCSKCLPGIVLMTL